MAKRYSGLLQARITYIGERPPTHPMGARPGHYRVRLTSPLSGSRNGLSFTLEEGARGYPKPSLDSSVAYDEVFRLVFKAYIDESLDQAGRTPRKIAAYREDGSLWVARTCPGASMLDGRGYSGLAWSDTQKAYWRAA